MFIIISRWAILCLKWHFTTRRLRNESLAETPIEKNKDNHSTPTQLAAWGIPALQTVAVLVARFVDADELLGMLTKFSFFLNKQFLDIFSSLMRLGIFLFFLTKKKSFGCRMFK